MMISDRAAVAGLAATTATEITARAYSAWWRAAASYGMIGIRSRNSCSGMATAAPAARAVGVSSSCKSVARWEVSDDYYSIVCSSLSVRSKSPKRSDDLIGDKCNSSSRRVGNSSSSRSVGSKSRDKSIIVQHAGGSSSSKSDREVLAGVKVRREAH